MEIVVREFRHNRVKNRILGNAGNVDLNIVKRQSGKGSDDCF